MLGDAAGWNGPAELPEPEHDPERARQLADEVLSRPEYRWEEPADHPIERAVEWLGDRAGDVLSGLGGGGSLPGPVAWAVLAAVVALVALLVWRYRRRRARTGFARGWDGRVVVQSGDATVDWAAAAEAARAEGRWRDALRCGYRALVVELAAAGALGDLADRTAGELAGELAANRPPAAGPFGAATELFEATWYGDAPAGRAEVDRLAGLADEVRSLAREQGPEPAGASTGGRTRERVVS
ncbi:MAG TPA: DUF4129 domain-containing protein [Acidimicrobiales bacterium]